MLKLHAANLLLVSIDDLFRLLEKLLARVKVELLFLIIFNSLKLFLQHFRILIETSLAQVLRSPLHLYNSGAIV